MRHLGFECSCEHPSSLSASLEDLSRTTWVCYLHCSLLCTLPLGGLRAQPVSFATMECEDTYSGRWNALSKIMSSDISEPKLTLGHQILVQYIPYASTLSGLLKIYGDIS